MWKEKLNKLKCLLDRRFQRFFLGMDNIYNQHNVKGLAFNRLAKLPMPVCQSLPTGPAHNYLITPVHKNYFEIRCLIGIISNYNIYFSAYFFCQFHAIPI